jgi:hypothetical protein
MDGRSIELDEKPGILRIRHHTLDVLAGILLTHRRPSRRPSGQTSRPAPSPWIVGIFAAIAASILVVAPWIPTAAGSTLTFLVIEGLALITITVWSRRPGWGDRQILALTAGALFAYAWHAFTSPPAFDSASIVIVRISNVVFAALALTAVWIAARRIAVRATDPLAPWPAAHEGRNECTSP